LQQNHEEGTGNGNIILKEEGEMFVKNGDDRGK
jgi:hypothetical protein